MSREAIATPRVLVVEDYPAIRDLIADCLEAEGYEVSAAGDGREALDILACWRPDAIVLDLMMPVMTGWAVLEQQRRREDLAEIPVIVTSAVHDLDRNLGGMDVAAVVPKPFECEDLLGAVRGVLERGRRATGVSRSTPSGPRVLASAGAAL
jgi:DNA-binding response OmpR family regulator